MGVSVYVFHIPTLGCFASYEITSLTYFFSHCLNLLIYVNITLFSANNHKKESGSVLWEFTFFMTSISC